MKKTLSLILVLTLVLSSVITAILVASAETSPIKKTIIDITQKPTFSTTTATASTKAQVDGGLLKVTVSAYERQLLANTPSTAQTSFPNYLLYNNNAIFTAQLGSKVIVDVTYKVTGTPNATHGAQIGVATWSAAKSGSMWTKACCKHTADDVGKEFTLSADYTVKTNTDKAIKIAFSGGGKFEISAITVYELPQANVGDYAVVKYVDNNRTTAEFVRKGEAPFQPADTEEQVFKGWYANADFSGSAVTKISADITLYAKWSVEAGKAVIAFHDNTGDGAGTEKMNVGDPIDRTPTKKGYNFLGWYKYSNYYGRPVKTVTADLKNLYAKWEEANPETAVEVDLTKNATMVTTAKTEDSFATASGNNVVFDIYNYERQLSSTDASSTDSWFPCYYFTNKAGKYVQLTVGETYELAVTYKVVEVKAGDNIGLQIGFGADHQIANRTRTKGYRQHTKSDEGKEFTLSVSYVSDSKIYPKLLFSGQGIFEVTDVKINRVLPIVKDTVLGVQTYEDFKVGIENEGMVGDKNGIEITNEVNHTAGTTAQKSLKLTMNTNYQRMTGNSIVPLVQAGKNKPFAAQKGAAYQVTFYAYAKKDMNDLIWSVNSVGDATERNGYLKYYTCEIRDKVSLKRNEWKKITAYIPELKGCSAALNLISIAIASNGYDGNYVYIDDVEIKQLVDSEVIVYDTTGGTSLQPSRAFAGQPILSFREPPRSGYLFEGWYYDAACTKEAAIGDKFPTDASEMTLYAKWTKNPSVPTDYNGTFDPEYFTGKVPYENQIDDTDQLIYFENAKNMTRSVAWVKDAGINGNGNAEVDGAMCLTNEFFSAYADASGYNAVRLMNADGTPFVVVKGARYTLSLDYIFSGTKGVAYLIPVISEKSAYTGIGQGSFQTLERISVQETDTDYMSHQLSFVADRTGFFYLTLTGRDDNANVDPHCYEKVCVDNVKVLRDDDVVRLEFASGNSTAFTLFGKRGEKVVISNLLNNATSTYCGTYTDPAFTEKYNFVFPSEDTTVYLRYETEAYDTPSDFSKPIKLGFEETDMLNDFYRQSKHMTNWSRELQNEWLFITDDGQHAQGGSNYIKLNGFQHYWNQAKFALYDPNQPEHVMLLEKGQKYRVTVMTRCEDEYEAPVNMTVCLENPASRYLLAENGNVKLEADPELSEKGYTKFVGDIEVSEEMAYLPMLAIRRNANDLQTIYIDNVMVERLYNCTVKFEANGGSEIEPAEVQIHDPVFDPGVPYREGYDFIGWFSDKECKTEWDFDAPVEADMTLFAKWAVSKDEEPEDTDVDEPVADDTNDYGDTNVDFGNTDYDDEEVIGNGAAPELLDADAVVITGDKKADTQEESFPLWLLILIIGGSVVLVTGGVLWFVLARKKSDDGDSKQ